MKNKKVLISTIIVIMILQINSIANSKCKLYIEDTNKYSNDDNVTVKIYMENVNEEIVTLGFDLKYDTSKLEFVSAKASNNIQTNIKIVENKKELSKVTIGILAMEGLKNDGLYYTITFKVIDSSNDIPLDIFLRDVTDKTGNDVDIELENGIIHIVSEEKNEEIKRSPQHQKIEKFEITEIKELDNLDKFITENGRIDVAFDDVLVYETEDNSVIEVLENGIILPIKDGTTNVRVKLNDEVIGNAKIEIKEGKVSKILGTNKKLKFKETATTKNGVITNIEKEQKDNFIIIIIVSILILLIMFLIFKIINKKMEEN